MSTNQLKPLNYYANLPHPVDTTPLSPPQLRQLIVRMLDGTLAGAPLDKPRASFFPAWIEENWETLCVDPSGVVRWAAQYLQNVQNAIPQKYTGTTDYTTDTPDFVTGAQGCLAGGCA